MTYSLADYILSITSTDPTLNNMFGTISIGGDGSEIGNITFSIDGTLFSTTPFATGGWVHNKNLARTGTISINISQLSDTITKFKRICNIYYSGKYEGFTASLSSTDGEEVASGIDCFPTKIPDQSFGDTSSTQTWEFTSGKITFN